VLSSSLVVWLQLPSLDIFSLCMSHGRAEMGSTHARILAQITELQRLQVQARRNAVLGGWTEEEEVERQRRSDRIAELRCQLALVDGPLSKESL